MFKERLFKGVLLLWASILASLFYSVSASALSVSELEQISDTSEYIELAEPEEGYNFDATFLAKDQELSYKAIITNDEEYRIRISNITLNASSYGFLEYSFEGLEIGDELGIGDEAEIVVTVKTNNNNTRTVSEDYSLKVDYDFIKPEDNPVTTSNSFFKTAAAATVGVGAIVFLFARSKKLRHFAIIFTISSLGVYAVASNATAEEDTSFTILGKVNFINTYKVTVNPNGGKYNNTTDDTVVYRREGESYHVDEVSREHFQFIEWEVNPGELDSNNDIEIHADTTIKAKWNENTYTLTIKPNGGEYLGSTEEWSESFRPNEAAVISTPELEGYDFTGWTVEKGNVGADGIFTGSSINMVEDVTLVANYSIKQISVKIDPNGGTFNGEAAVYEDVVDWGAEINITNIARDGFDLKEWTVAEGNLGTDGILSAETSTITITEDTEIIANWWSSTFYTVTIIPNGGVYDGKTEASEYSVREGTDYSMLEATYEGQLFHYWHYTDTETHMDDTSFTVTGDVSLTAEWQPIIARIERTQKLYPSIMAAHEEAESGDTITLLVDTSEIVTNSKNVTLDLNTHTVSGYLVNTADGNLLLVNGEFNNYENSIKDETNPYGAAAINNGILTLGYDDYTDNDNYNKAPLIDNDYVRLVGDERGLIQNNIFYFYDGHIDGDLGLVGGYDGSPWYRDTDSPDHEDTQEVHYYPHVSRLTRDEASFQRVQLANSNRAVSRTIDHGAIYYYELQDNIDMSAVTGYTIYAARNFDGSNPTEIASGDTIVFDTDGYKVDLGGTFVNNGTLTIKDGKTGEAKGELTTGKTIENNGSLTIQDITITGTQETLLHNSDTVELKNSKLITNSSIAYEVLHSDEQLIMDEDSLIESKNSNYPALKLKADFEVNSGYFKGADCAVSVDRGYNFTFGGGLITSDATAVCVPESNSLTTINGGKIKSSGTNTNGIKSIYSPVNFNDGEVEVIASSSATGITSSNLEMKGGRVVVSSDGNATGINGSATITKGTVTVTATGGGTASGIDSGTFNINGDGVVISATSANGPAYGSSYGSTTITNGTVSAYSTNGVAYGNYSNGATITLNGENAKLLAHSVKNNAQGTATYDTDGYFSGFTAGTIIINMSAGEISAIADDATKIGIGVEVSSGNFTGGKIYGSTYGAHYNRQGTRGATITLGKNEAPLYNGEADPETSVVYEAKPLLEGGKYGVYDMEIINFYDGLISGGINYVTNEALIKAIPDGTRLNKERDEDNNEDCWLKYEEPYLQLEDGSKWRSLGEAYDHVGDNETITVIRDMSTQATLPNNSKNITIDLNGFKLEYTQPISNTGSLTFVDGDTEHHRGEIINRNSTLIDNNGSLEIRSGTFNGGNCTVDNKSGKTFNLKGGTLTSTATTVCNYAVVSVTGGNIVASGSNAKGISGGTIEVSGGTINATGSSSSVGIDANIGKITGGTIKATGTNGADATAVGLSQASSYINGASVDISAKAESGIATAISTYYGFTYTNGKASAESTDGEAWGIYGSSDATVAINGQNAKLSVESTNNNARGSYTYAYESFWSGWHYCSLTINMSAGDIYAKAGKSDKLGIGFDATTMNITGGKVYGSTYGLHYTRSSREAIATLGKNEAPLYNGEADPDTEVVYPATPQIEGGKYGVNNTSVYFYDGIISGGLEYALDTDKIKAIPDGTYQHINTREDGQDSWLQYEEPYLLLEDGSRWRSLSEAYDHVGNNETITVLRDMSTQALLPDNGKSITIDLNGNKLTYSQPIRNSGTLKIVDSDTEYHRGSIENTITNAIYNTGTLEIDSGTISGNECAVNNDHKDAVFTLNNGSIEASKIAICNNGTVNINDGTVKAEGGAVMGVRNYGTLNMTDGEILITSSGGNSASYGIYSGYDNITGGKIKATGTGSAKVYGILASSSTESLVKDTDIIVEAENGTASGVASGSATLTVDSSTISSSSTNGLALGYHYDGCNTSYFNIRGNTTITVESTNNDAKGTKAEVCYGLWSTDFGLINFTMESGELSVKTHDKNKVGIGVEARSVVAKGGSIYGSTYGIDYSVVNSSNVTLGIKDNTLSNNNPVIEGGSGYGINSFTNMYYYDGRVKGSNEAISNIRHIRDAATDANLHDEKSGDVDTKYLVPGEYIAQIGSMSCETEGAKCYKTIKAAVEASSEGDVITLLGDDYLFYYLTLPEGKKFTLDLDGHKIITGNKITNYSDFTLTNNGSDVIVDYVEGDYFITNKSGAKLSLDKVKLSTASAIYGEQNGSLTIKDSTINSTNIAVESYSDLAVEGSNILGSYSGVRQKNGQISIDGSTIQGDANSYNGIALYVESANGSITESTIEMNTGSYSSRPAYDQKGSAEIDMDDVTIHGQLLNESGTVRIEDSEISVNDRRGAFTLVSNAGAMSISGESIITNNAIDTNTYDSNFDKTITNSGTLTIDGAKISRTDSDNYGVTNIGIENRGTLTIVDSEVSVSSDRKNYGVISSGGQFDSIRTSYTVSGGLSYGMNISNNAVVNLLDGSLDANGADAYGINIENGIVTLGEAEPIDSPNRGTANADVSTTDPLVKAVGTNTGYAITFNQGDFNYYDGKLIQNEQGFPVYKVNHTEKATITNKEYWYEPQAAQDGDGHYYYILTYMPEG